MKYIIMDLESTCWERRDDSNVQEIIEIGAVKLDASLDPIEEFNRFVRPIENPKLSQFCINLTHIKQHDVDRADTFGVVLPDFLKWIGEGSHTMVTWGDYDINQMQMDCRRHSMKFLKNLKTLQEAAGSLRP